MPGAPEPFLSDERRRELAAASGLALRTSEDCGRARALPVLRLPSRATEQVVLSYRSSDEEGNLELPSPFLADVEDLLAAGWAQRRRKRLLADVVWPPELAPTPSELERSLAAPPGSAGRGGAGPDRVLHQAALSHVRHREVVSAGALEAFAELPGQLAGRARAGTGRVRARRRRVDARELHARRCSSGCCGGSVARSPRPRCHAPRSCWASFSPTVPRRSRRGGPRRCGPGALRSIEADLRRYLVHEAADGCGWAPQGLELRFGFAQDDEDRPSLPALTLRDGDAQISVRGLIDRVDVEPGDSGRAVVRDYKSGGARNEHQGARWALDDQLQVALYMLAVRELLGLSPVAGLYQPLGGNDLRARGVFLEGAPVGAKVVDRDSRTPEELEEVLSVARERAVALAAALRSGELEPSPQTCSRDGCRYPGICRSQ